MGYVDHAAVGGGEPAAGLLRPATAGSNTAADHITTAQLALAQRPKKYRRGHQTLFRLKSREGRGGEGRRGRSRLRVGQAENDRPVHRARAGPQPAFPRRPSSESGRSWASGGYVRQGAEAARRNAPHRR